MAAREGRDEQVRAFGQANGFRAVESRRQGAHAIDPGARRVHPEARGEFEPAPRQPVFRFGGNHLFSARAGRRCQAPDFRVVHRDGTVLGGVKDVFECQARVVGD